MSRPYPELVSFAGTVVVRYGSSEVRVVDRRGDGPYTIECKTSLGDHYVEFVDSATARAAAEVLVVKLHAAEKLRSEAFDVEHEALLAARRGRNYVRATV